MKSLWTRRELIRRTGAGAALLPFVPLLEEEAMAQVSPRLLILFHPHGSHMPSLPAAVDTMSAHAGRLLQVDGLGNPLAGNEHYSAISTLLIGVGDPGRFVFGGPSIDQIIANKIGAGTGVKSIQLGVHVGPTSITAAGRGQKLPAEEKPASAFMRLFGSGGGGGTVPGGATGGGDATDLARLKAEGKTVVDHVTAAVNSLKMRMGAADRANLDRHVTAVVELQRELESLGAPAPGGGGGGGAACNPSPVGSGSDYASLVKGHIDVVARAFACDRTRVATLMMSYSPEGEVWSWAGASGGYHDNAHSRDGGGKGSAAAYGKITTWLGGRMAYALDQLKAAGPVAYDNTLVVWITMYGGFAHDARGIPAIVYSGKNLPVKTGKASGNSTAAFWLACARSLGVDLASFGGTSSPLAGFAA
jgi:hypothetical protein